MQKLTQQSLIARAQNRAETLRNWLGETDADAILIEELVKEIERLSK